MFFTYFSFMFLAYFVLLKVILIVLHFINSLFKKKSVRKLTQMTIKMPKIGYFSFNLMLKNNKKKPLK